MKNLKREVAILKNLPSHQTVVQCLDVFEEEDWFAFVLELVGHGFDNHTPRTLFQSLLMRNPPVFRNLEAAFVLRQLVVGLNFLHGHGVIHRDLKLENVLVASARRRGRDLLINVKIADFGLSKMVGGGLSEARSFV